MANNTRAVLLSSATTLLDNGGAEAVTLREVGRMSGVSHMAPYKHFADKEALLAAVATQELERMHALIDDAASREPTPGRALRRALHSYVDWALAHPVRFSLIFGRWSMQQEEMGEAAEAARGALVDAVRRGQDSGEVAPGEPERCAALLLSTVHGAVMLSLGGHLAREGKGRADPGDLLDDQLDLLGTTAEARVTRPTAT